MKITKKLIVELKKYCKKKKIDDPKGNVLLLPYRTKVTKWMVEFARKNDVIIKIMKPCNYVLPVNYTLTPGYISPEKPVKYDKIQALRRPGQRLTRAPGRRKHKRHAEHIKKAE